MHSMGGPVDMLTGRATQLRETLLWVCMPSAKRAAQYRCGWSTSAFHGFIQGAMDLRGVG